jgi:hypothetical protein
MAFEEEEQMACSEVVSQKETTNSEEWLREVENLSDTEEKVVHICEPEVRKNLSDDEGEIEEINS